jgi:hypothetical protein
MSLLSGGLYSPLPQSEDSNLAEFGPGIDTLAATALDNLPTPTPAGPLLSSELVERQIRWIHFILGCSVLLPWNGIRF